MNLMHLANDFASSLNAELKEEHQNIFKISLDEFEVFISYFAKNNTIMLHTSLAPHNDSKETLLHLLKMNNFFAKTNGICLGIDDEIITAQQNIYAKEHLDTATFMTQCQNFLEGVAELVPYLNNEANFKSQDIENTQQNLNPIKGIRC